MLFYSFQHLAVEPQFPPSVTRRRCRQVIVCTDVVLTCIQLLPPVMHSVRLNACPHHTYTVPCFLPSFIPSFHSISLLALTFWHRNFTCNSNKSPNWCNTFSVYYPDVCLQLNMFRAFSRPSSGAQWLQWRPLGLPSYRGDSHAVFVVEPAGSYIVFNFDIFRPEWRVRLSFSSMRPANPSHFILAVSSWLCTDYEDQLDVVFYPFSRYVLHWD